MKKGLLYCIIALAAIIIVVSFNMQLGVIPQQNIPAELTGKILYVCPTTSIGWDSAALALRPFVNYVIAAYFFTLVLLMFGWGWQLYQNLLSDKFKRESFKNIWSYTKIWFWALVIGMLVLITPNGFRRINLTNNGSDWILCESSDACDIHDPKCHTRVVRAEAVQIR